LAGPAVHSGEVITATVAWVVAGGRDRCDLAALSMGGSTRSGRMPSSGLMRACGRWTLAAGERAGRPRAVRAARLL